MPSLAISRRHTNIGPARSKRWNVFLRVFYKAHRIEGLNARFQLTADNKIDAGCVRLAKYATRVLPRIANSPGFPMRC